MQVVLPNRGTTHMMTIFLFRKFKSYLKRGKGTSSRYSYPTASFKINVEKKNQSLSSYSPRPRWVRYLLGYLSMFLCSLGTRTKIFGRQHIPDSGPYVVVINHFSYIDPVFVIHAIQKPISFLAASDQVIEIQFIWAPFL